MKEFIKIGELEEEQLEYLVRKRLNQKKIFDEAGTFLHGQEHDRFNFTGYSDENGSALYHNMVILEKFYHFGLFPSDINRQGIRTINVWKGTLIIFDVDYTSLGTVDIIMRLLLKYCSERDVVDGLLNVRVGFNGK